MMQGGYSALKRRAPKSSVMAILTLGIVLLPSLSFAGQFDLELLKVFPDKAGAQTYSVNIQILAIMTMLTMLPAMVLMMTSFTRIVIVLAILRQALGMPQTPSNQIIIGLSLFLSFFIMTPIITEINNNVLQPYMNDKIDQKTALLQATLPIKKFMFEQTRENDLHLFHELSRTNTPIDEDVSKIPLSILLPAFITSELKTAFQIGFIIFIPFLIIDLVVASVLMSMGMMMMSPLIISLPFKLMLFVLVDGWNLLLGTLATSFITGG